MKTYYVTKWWQTKGIFTVKGELTESGYVNKHPVFVKLGRQAFETRAEAVAAIKALAERRLRALARETTRVQKILDVCVLEMTQPG